ncbi:MAG: membrane protein insertase YidC, partial [Cyanobacteria bacterium J06607_13]
IFQTAQSFILSREPLPENLQKLVDAQAKAAGNGSSDNRQKLAFEPGAGKKAAKSDATKAKSGKADSKKVNNSKTSRANKLSAKKGSAKKKASK